MDEVLASLISSTVKKNKIDPMDIGDVITGCAFQVSENWLYGGRHPVLLAGLPIQVPGMAIDRACSSSLAAMAMGCWSGLNT